MRDSKNSFFDVTKVKDDKKNLVPLPKTIKNEKRKTERQKSAVFHRHTVHISGAIIIAESDDKQV